MTPRTCRMASEEHFDVAPIRTYQQVADEMTRRGHPIPRNSINYYEKRAMRKIRAALESEGWV